VAIDHPCGHGRLVKGVPEAEELLEAHSLQVPLPVAVELFEQGGILLPELLVFILHADEEKVPVPAIVQTLERDTDHILDGGRRLQDHLPEKSRFGKAGNAVGKHDQRDDQKGGCHDDGRIFSGD
jgi:hypothetical protein